MADPKGEEQVIPKSYEPGLYESKIYSMWKEKNYFAPRKSTTGETFSIMIPPPNVTGELHVGHAVGTCIQDSLIRYHRMKGDETLYLPGTDHAGIATQIVVEKGLEKEGKKKTDFTREEFTAKVWDWVETYKKRILGQLETLGASLDWSREQFTLSDTYSKSVEKAFIQLYKKGLIYRGDYIVNWCSKSGTVLSDLEVISEDRPNKLYYVRYFVKAADKSVVVATTRPETLLGDVAVAVHPDDKRYKELHDKVLILPVFNKEIPIICDKRVDMNFGTGAVKITPAHDAFDFEMAKDHDLPVISVIGKDGRMNKNAGKYAGLDVLQARNNIIEYLDNIGNLEKIEETISAIKKCERTGGDVEPLVMKQWFVKTKELSERSMAAVEKEQTMIIPERFEKEYMRWMEGMRDWCISRQLWWGHRIPAWYNGEEVFVGDKAPKGEGWIQDEDVLDTWFSSALWPFASLGWPEGSEDMKKFFPTTVLETAYDILFFWVSRMMMLSIELTGEVPFRYVYLHGLVRDEQHRKFSKSKGIGFAPEEIQNEYGTDALRLLLMLGTSPGHDVTVSKEKTVGFRNFVNKLWNAARYIRMQTESKETFEELEADIMKNYKKLNFAQHWILSRLNSLVEEVTIGFEEFTLGDAGTKLYEFTWNEFCDWYLEISKIENNEYSDKVLKYGMMMLLKLWHPFTPFVTEAIWEHFSQKEHLIISNWPLVHDSLAQEEKEKDFALLIEVVKAIRNLRNEKGVEAGKEIPVYIMAESKKELIEEFTDVMKRLARLSEVHLVSGKPDIKKKVVLVVYPFEIWIPLEEMIDIGVEKERLLIQIKDVEKTLVMVSAKLDNPSFIENAPAEVVAFQKKKKHDTVEVLEKLKNTLEEIE